MNIYVVNLFMVFQKKRKEFHISYRNGSQMGENKSDNGTGTDLNAGYLYSNI